MARFVVHFIAYIFNTLILRYIIVLHNIIVKKEKYKYNVLTKERQACFGF